MARISGVDIPKQKRGVIALTYIYGIGRSRTRDISNFQRLVKTPKFQIGQMKRLVEFERLLEL